MSRAQIVFAGIAAIALILLVLLLTLGNSVCNRNSHKDCKGEWVGTECGPRGRGYTCTDNGNGGILTPECSCLDGQGNPPKLEVPDVYEFKNEK